MRTLTLRNAYFELYGRTSSALNETLIAEGVILRFRPNVLGEEFARWVVWYCIICLDLQEVHREQLLQTVTELFDIDGTRQDFDRVDPTEVAIWGEKFGFRREGFPVAA